MVGNGNQGDWTGYRKVSKLGYINQKLVYGYTFSELPAESAVMSQRYVIHRSENMCFSWSEINTQQIFCMQLSIDTNYTLAVNNDYMIVCTKWLSIKQQLEHGYGECEWSINDFWTSKWDNWKASGMLLFITHVLAALIGKRKSDTDTAQCWKSESTEWLWFVVLYVCYLGSDLLAVMDNQSIGSLHSRNRKWHGNSPILKMSVNGASMIFGLVRNLIGKWFARCYS